MKTIFALATLFAFASSAWTTMYDAAGFYDQEIQPNGVWQGMYEITQDDIDHQLSAIMIHVGFIELGNFRFLGLYASVNETDGKEPGNYAWIHNFTNPTSSEYTIQLSDVDPDFDVGSVIYFTLKPMCKDGWGLLCNFLSADIWIRLRHSTGYIYSPTAAPHPSLHKNVLTAKMTTGGTNNYWKYVSSQTETLTVYVETSSLNNVFIYASSRTEEPSENNPSWVQVTSSGQRNMTVGTWGLNLFGSNFVSKSVSYKLCIGDDCPISASGSLAACLSILLAALLSRLL